MAAKDLFSGNFYFYNLNHLELQTDYSRSDLLGMAALFKHSPKLETVILDRNLKLDEEVSFFFLGGGNIWVGELNMLLVALNVSSCHAMCSLIPL